MLEESRRRYFQTVDVLLYSDQKQDHLAQLGFPESQAQAMLKLLSEHQHQISFFQYVWQISTMVERQFADKDVVSHFVREEQQRIIDEQKGKLADEGDFQQFTTFVLALQHLMAKSETRVNSNILLFPTQRFSQQEAKKPLAAAGD